MRVTYARKIQRLAIPNAADQACKDHAGKKRRIARPRPAEYQKPLTARMKLQRFTAGLIMV